MATMTLSVAAVAEQGVFYINGSAGSINFDKDTALDTNRLFQLGGEYLVTDNVGVELGYGYSDPKIKRALDRTYLDHLFLNGYYYFGERARLQPYVSAGIGHADFHADAYDSKETFLNAGVGARLHVTDRVSLRFDARALNSVDQEDWQEQYTIGVSYAFGVSKPAPAPAPVAVVAAPAPAPAAPLDSDGDGVTDDQDLCPDTPAGAEVNSKGCEVLKVATFEQRLMVTFPTDSAEVQPGDLAEIERFATFMKKYPEVSTQIEGHTDSDGSEQYNMRLSQRRADAVRDVLVQRYGIEPGRLTAVGFGESKPIASNATAAGKAQNRRVVAVVTVEKQVK
jgi:OOP family OmpA-OmpF porin